MGYVFLSYARPDQAYIKRLAAEADRRGITVWFDADIKSGERWDEIIEGKVRGCAAFAPLVTPASRDSAWCRRELLLADQLGKPLHALVRHGTEVPMLLLDRQHETVTGGQLPTDSWFATLATSADGAIATAVTATSNETESTSANEGNPQTALLDAQIIRIGRSLLPPTGTNLNEFYGLIDERLKRSAPLSDLVQEVLSRWLTRSPRDSSPRQIWRVTRLRKQWEQRPDYNPVPSS